MTDLIITDIFFIDSGIDDKGPWIELQLAGQSIKLPPNYAHALGQALIDECEAMEEDTMQAVSDDK